MAIKSEINKKDLINLQEISNEEFSRITDNLYSQLINYKLLPNLVLLPNVNSVLREKLGITGKLYITKNRLLHTNPVRKNAHKEQGFSKDEYKSIPDIIRNATYALKESESSYNSFLLTFLDKNNAEKVNCIIFDEDKNGNLLTTIKKIPLLSLRNRIYEIVGAGVEPAISNALREPSTTLTTSPNDSNLITKEDFVNTHDNEINQRNVALIDKAYKLTRSEYLENKTELSDEDIVRILDLPAEKEIRTQIKSYTDKDYLELAKDNTKLSQLTESLKNDAEYLTYRGSYIAKSKLLYESPVTLCNEIPSLLIGEEIGESFYLLPYGYAKDKSENFKKFADMLERDNFIDIKRNYSTKLKHNFKKGHNQGNNIFFFITSDKTDYEKIRQEINKCVYNRKEVQNKTAKYIVYIEQSNRCGSFSFDTTGKLVTEKEYTLKQIRSFDNERPLVARGRMQSIPSGTIPILNNNDETVNNLFHSLLLRGEIEMINVHPELHIYSEKYKEACKKLENISKESSSELLRKSNSQFLESEKQTQFYKDLQKGEEKNMENTNEERNVALNEEQKNKSILDQGIEQIQANGGMNEAALEADIDSESLDSFFYDETEDNNDSPSENEIKAAERAYQEWEEMLDDNQKAEEIIEKNYQREPVFLNPEELKSSLKTALNEVAKPLEVIPFTRENYNLLFPYSRIESPIENVKLGEHQFEKLDVKERQLILKAVHDTITTPDIIINENRKTVFNDEKEAHVYAKSFKLDGKNKAVQSVIVAIEDDNISISTHLREINNVVNKIKMPEQLIYASAEIGQVVERITGKQLVTVNPTRVNENIVPPKTNISQDKEKSTIINNNEKSQENHSNAKKQGISIFTPRQEEEILSMIYENHVIGENLMNILYNKKRDLYDEIDKIASEKTNGRLDIALNQLYHDKFEDYKIKKEATDTIQTVIAQNSYALEHSSIREQVGAVIDSIPLANEKSTIINNNEKSQKSHSNAKEYMIQTTRLFLSKLKEKSLPFLQGKEQGSKIIIKPQAVRDAATGKAFTGYPQLMAQALIQAVYEQKKIPELEYELITYDQAKACGTFIKKGSPHITLTNYNPATNAASKQMYYFKSGCNSPEMIDLHNESIARNRAIKRIRLSLEEKEIPSERQTEEKNKITLLHYEEMTYLKALNKDTKQYFDSLPAEEKNMLTELCKKTPLTQKTVKELAETLRKDRLISTQLSLQKNSERYFDAKECIVPEDFIGKAMAAASLGCSLETTQGTIDRITKDLHQTLSRNIEHYDYGKPFETGEIINGKCRNNIKDMCNKEYEAEELAKKIEQQQMALKKNPINALMELLNRNDLSDRTIGGYER